MKKQVRKAINDALLARDEITFISPISQEPVLFVIRRDADNGCIGFFGTVYFAVSNDCETVFGKVEDGELIVDKVILALEELNARTMELIEKNRQGGVISC